MSLQTRSSLSQKQSLSASDPLVSLEWLKDVDIDEVSGRTLYAIVTISQSHQIDPYTGSEDFSSIPVKSKHGYNSLGRTLKQPLNASNGWE